MPLTDSQLAHDLLLRTSTPRDLEILSLLSTGMSNLAISRHLSLSPRTVKQHLRSMGLRIGGRPASYNLRIGLALAFLHSSCTPSPVPYRVLSQLSLSRIQICRSIYNALSNRTIAQQLGTTEDGVKARIVQLFNLIGVNSRLELALYVAHHGGEDFPISP